MPVDIGMTNVENVDRPAEGVVNEFMTHLMSNAYRINDRCFLGFYSQKRMERMAEEYLGIYPTKHEQIGELFGWIRSLPWQNGSRLAITFNW